MSGEIKLLMIKDLLSMGYRPMDDINKPIFGKPIGYHLFTFELDKLLWTNWFKSNCDPNTKSDLHINGMCIWNSIKYTADDWETIDTNTETGFIQFLKSTEKYTNIQTGNNSNFEFITIDQAINNFL